MREWRDRTAYEVAMVEGKWFVLVKGGDYYMSEPPFRVQASAPDADEAWRICRALRATLE